MLRLATPYERRPGLFESFFHAGSLAFPEDELKDVLRLLDAVPTLVCVNLERPAVLPEITERAAALIADSARATPRSSTRLRAGDGRGAAALRTAALDGGGAGVAPRRARRHAGSGVPVRARPGSRMRRRGA
ncbi:hypothetical protein [Streptomyces sp. NPDC005046]